MHLKTRNVNTAFHELVEMFNRAPNSYTSPNGVQYPTKNKSRNGDVLKIDEPVLITYTHPRERVLFNAARDANPFFHLYEAMWMLAGRNDVAPLAYYNSKISQYSDDGKTFNGAYGYRWRHAAHAAQEYHGDGCLGYDQLDILVNHLKADPNSRRAVLQMWNVEDDLLNIGGSPLPTCDCGADRSGPTAEAHKVGCPASKPVRTDGRVDLGSKDVCCNLSVMFSLREWTNGADHAYDVRRGACPKPYVLDMTVTNRSNDLIYGLLGANYVHFTILQEYMAARLGVEVGVYNHFTNNLHVYDWNWKPEEWLKNAHVYDYGFHVGACAKPEYSFPLESNKFIPLVKDPTTFEQELPEWVELYSGPYADNYVGVPMHDKDWQEPFLHNAAGLMIAWACYKANDLHSALSVMSQVEMEDWCTAGINWLQKRVDMRMQK